MITLKEPRARQTSSRVREARVRWLAIATAIVGLVYAIPGNAQVYTLDDGSVDLFGGTPSGDLLALNHFNTGGASVYINEISVLWNPISARVSPTVVLYSDPNGDGNPMDMVPLRITPIYIPPSVVVLNNTTHQVYSITPTIVTGSFFVGAFLSDREFSFDPVIGVDTSHPLSNQSWIFENTTLGGLNLSSPQTTSTTIAPLNQYLAGNHMIRARYTPVPEPSAFFLAGMFVIGTYMRHRAAGRNT